MFMRFFSKVLRGIVFPIIPALMIALFVNTFVTETSIMEQGPSMQPNLFVGDRVMTEKVSYRFREPVRGDIVVVERGVKGVDLVKRVIGLPGEVIEVRSGHVWINGELQLEPYAQNFGGPDYGPALIPIGQVFVLGDNRRISHDSRMIGPVSLEVIQRRVLFVYWPLEGVKFFP